MWDSCEWLSWAKIFLFFVYHVFVFPSFLFIFILSSFWPFHCYICYFVSVCINMSVSLSLSIQHTNTSAPHTLNPFCKLTHPPSPLYSRTLLHTLLHLTHRVKLHLTLTLSYFYTLYDVLITPPVHSYPLLHTTPPRRPEFSLFFLFS